VKRGGRAKASGARAKALIAALSALARDPVLPGVISLVALSLLDEYVWIGALLSELSFHVALLSLLLALVFALRRRFARALLFAACALFFAQGALAQVRETRPTPLHGPTLRVAQAHASGHAPSEAQVARLLASRNVDVLSLTGLGANQVQRLAQSPGDYRGIRDEQGGRLLLIRRALAAPAPPQGSPLVRLGRCQLELVQVELPSLFAAARANERKQRIARAAHAGREARRVYLGSFGSGSDAADLAPLRASQELRDARIGHGRLATAPDRLGPSFGLPVDHILLHGWILAREATSEAPLAPEMHRTLIATLELTEPRCAVREPARR
jgi:endonuclease/exonuclease/phosphatase (EEP) superfamily protein YafD